jgi:hypothetical protein
MRRRHLCSTLALLGHLLVLMIWVNETELVGTFGCSGIHVISGNARALRIYLRTEHPLLIHEIEQFVVSVQSLPFRRIRNIFEGKLVKPVKRGTIVCRVLHVDSINSSLNGWSHQRALNV